VKSETNPTLNENLRSAIARRRAPGMIAGGIAATLTAAIAGEALARTGTPVLQQITNLTTGTIVDPRIRSQGGESIVFTSDGDVTGPAPGHNEIYFYDVNTAAMTRLTTTAGGESRDASRATDTVGAGDRPEQVTFVSTGDLDPAVGNADGNPEIFIWRKDTNTFHQLTNTPAGVINQEPFASDSGKCVVFASTGNFDNNTGQDPAMPATNHTNVDGSLEIFQFNLLSSVNYPADGFFTQVSDGPAGTESTRPVVGGYIFQRQCQTTAYMSDYDQTGDGSTGINIFEFDRDSAKTVMMLSGEVPWAIQPGNYLYPHISVASPFARGPFIVFQTDADHWRNGSDGWEMFRFRAFHPRMTQYTDYLTGSVERPVVSDGGGYIAFQSNGEILFNDRRARLGGEAPFNDDGNYEIFRLRGRRRAWQITRSEGCNNDLVSMRDDGTAIVFRSDCDLIPGHNLSGQQQVFLYREVKGDDPLAGAGCLLANGCCNEANGCYQPIYGEKPQTRSKGCLDKAKGCETLQQ
jgi:hypothetical protein